MEYKKYCWNIIKRLNEVISDKFKGTPNYRYHMVLAIKEYAGDEFLSMNDVWDLAVQTDEELKLNIENIIEYYNNQIKEEEWQIESN